MPFPHKSVDIRAHKRQNIFTEIGTVSTTGGEAMRAAPGAGKRIVITRFKLQNESDVETLAEIKAGSTGIERLLLEGSKGMGESETYQPDARPRGGENEAIELHLDGANQVGYTLHGFEEDV
jgi:hypothetical protein